MEIDAFKVQIGERLKEFAKKAGFTTQELAEKLGYKPSTFYRVLKGENGISVDLLLSIVKSFPNFDWVWLFRQMNV